MIPRGGTLDAERRTSAWIHSRGEADEKSETLMQKDTLFYNGIERVRAEGKTRSERKKRCKPRTSR